MAIESGHTQIVEWLLEHHPALLDQLVSVGDTSPIFNSNKYWIRAGRHGGTIKIAWKYDNYPIGTHPRVAPRTAAYCMHANGDERIW